MCPLHVNKHMFPHSPGKPFETFFPYLSTIGILLVSKDTSSFMTNTLLILQQDLIKVDISYRINKTMIVKVRVKYEMKKCLD